MQTKHQDTKVGNVEIDHRAQDQGIAATESAGRCGPQRPSSNTKGRLRRRSSRGRAAP